MISICPGLWLWMVSGRGESGNDGDSILSTSVLIFIGSAIAFSANSTLNGVSWNN